MPIINYEPFIFARAVNWGIANALSRDIMTDIVIMNDDTQILSENFFQTLHDMAYAHKAIGLIAPSVEGITGQRLQKSAVGEYIFTDFVPFICVFIKNEAIKEVGFLDERFNKGYGYEDNDYCHRLVKAKFSIAITCKAKLSHIGMATTHATREQLIVARTIYEEKWNA